METVNIAIDQIQPNPYQPRQAFDPDALFELAQSIRANGLIQPVVVRRQSDHYEIIVGERRYRAMILAGFTEIPCLVRETPDDESARMALIENIQRENLSAIEEAQAYAAILASTHITQEQMARMVGKSQSAVANKLRLLQLDPEVREAIANRQLGERHARALLGLDVAQQKELAQTIIRKQLNAVQSEQLANNARKHQEPSHQPKSKGFSKSVRIALNSFKKTEEMVQKLGIACTSETMETDDAVIVRIRIAKEKEA